MRIATTLRAGLLLALAALPASAQAATEAPQPPQLDWSFSGIFGTFDQGAAQRGFMVYQQVCATCHSMELIYFRDLEGIGVPEEAVKAIASQVQVTDGPNDEGEMFERPGLPSDRMPSPFSNEAAARVANAGAYPPDLSLIVDARFDGANYLHGLMTGYREPPPDVELQEGMYYNEYFPGHQIAMPPPLAEGIVEYPDGTEATVEQMARDVTVFLAYAAEPNMVERKQTGVMVILFLVILTILFYLTKRKVWAEVH